ncbi:MAG TPA: class I SAM-dependent methyltransferase [Phototrophicaceae bacterium]|jgi:ubiquinone/menaquinone biosynthesis C-methylase UbiE|nr:class I SAM-dependent methyltransferase [Phototrophicaceae bacterium]
MTDNDHFIDIYMRKASAYDQMVAREDYQHHLLPALTAIHPLKDALVAEFGAGTGRLTRLLAPEVRRIYAFDFSAHMLETAAPTLPSNHNWTLAVGDNHHMPARAHLADIAIAGWSFGHATGWYPDRWRDDIAGALAEMERLVVSGGVLIILETLGTGSETPTPPSQSLADYYHWLETERGFSATWIRTDYQFASVQEADQLTRFFFGDGLADRIVSNQMTILPECTGIWWRKV